MLEISKLKKEIIILPQTLNSSLNFKFSKIYLREHLSTMYCRDAEFAPDLALVIDYPNKNFKHKEVGIFLREDAEGINYGNNDLKKSIGDPVKMVKNYQEYIDLAGSYETIITDRLHFAIAALGQQRNVFLLPGIYHKNYGVWIDYLKTFGCNWLKKL